MHEGWKLADRVQYSNVCNCTELYYSLLVPTCFRCQGNSSRVVLYPWITWLIGKQQSGDESCASDVNIVLMSDHTCFNTECILKANYTSECKVTLSALIENV